MAKSAKLLTLLGAVAVLSACASKPEPQPEPMPMPVVQPEPVYTGKV